MTADTPSTTTDAPTLNVVLFQPQIPNNTGNIGRTCMTTRCRLHIIHPISFEMDEKARRRAGLDYWHLVDCREHASWEAFLEHERPTRLWLYTTRATRVHWDARIERGDYILFGQENGGVPAWMHDWVATTHGEGARLTLPMIDDPQARSLNLATAAACAIFEGVRQMTARGSPPYSIAR
jgi:tRNA (cytidine/uridine-2'-O-)-methyltransferase